MTRQAKKALLKSIEKWEANLTIALYAQSIDDISVAQNELVMGSYNCPLCRLQYKIFSISYCSGCPIRDVTLQNSCYGTPYNKVYRWLFDVNQSFKVLINAISKEVEFLYSVLDIHNKE